ncbi:hypothetical protein [Brevibacillus centrosporus]|uniref:hypothetical protein n=1 Tax=Brevibacillus centrosporus TaxID=54910 RepID=UPI00398598DC
MRTIKTIQDVRLIRAAQVFSDTLTSYLEEEFLGLKEAFDFDGLDEEFSLDHYGFMVVLEQGDNLRDLSVVGLDRETGGLFRSLPEFVDKVDRQGECWYKVVVIYTNEYAMSFVIPESTVGDDEELKTFLEAHVE